ncbi:MAG: 1,6-anhydro-N-acetylmuramyl-L-alanine amidase AmpD [Burkholderiaceae bacterium]
MKRAVWQGGWWTPARRLDSPNHDARPHGQEVDLVVLHSISLPPGEYGGDAVERLFTNRLDPSAHPYYEALGGLHVSAHFFLRRDGSVLQFVDGGQRAWHAGVSSWRGRERCNDQSIGIEIEGLEGHTFEDAQYARLGVLLPALLRRCPIHDVVGHEHVAPGRKADPGPGFDWRRLGRALNRPTQAATPILRLRTPYKPG